ncbi:division/cell wall cluster transcriptional repressor MraZ [Pseudoroseicyclus tamaricis]|uniref:Transcriptional regulator MraZ n=1 Tax=Pseudoroseicyclus tamaricis TaxID=2705421 RepID=A0A6B2JNT6_9RHOB|nr:cell division/cell wall cluster transcriptional repressor MraZ [Pseudoroseicyclus tamaricis]NDV00357.1 cell division/cell wall cluster transcriptional repressor MraZ [Pseudoroseicyclus tamaricis]
MSSFTGEHDQRIDGKGRVSIPMPFRGALGQQDPEWTAGQPTRFYLQYSDDLKGYLRGWDVRSIERRQRQYQRWDPGPKKKLAIRYFFRQISLIVLDKDGRMVLPQKQRERLGVEGDDELKFLGYGDYFEIWRAEVADEGDDHDALLAQLGPDFDPQELADLPPDDDFEPE